MKPTLPFAQYDKDENHLHILHKDIPDVVTNLYTEEFVRQQQERIFQLERLADCYVGYDCREMRYIQEIENKNAEIEALKYEKSSGVYDPEPVAWMDKRTSKCVVFINTPPSDDWIPLYTHPAETITLAELRQTELYRKEQTKHLRELLEPKTLTNEEIIKEINSLATGWFSNKFEKGLFITEEAMVNLIQSVLRKSQEK